MRRVQQQSQHPPAASPAVAAAAPIIDNTQLPKPVLLKTEDEGSISVKISGYPRPVVRWQIGRKRIKESSKFQLKTDSTGVVHSLVIARVTGDLDQGVWVIATNQHGEDCCMIDVKTYSMLIGSRLTNTEVSANDPSGDDAKKVRKKTRRGSSHDTQSIVSLDTYQAEMAHRKRMRSADVLNNSIDAQSSYSESLVNHRPPPLIMTTEGARSSGVSGAGQPPSGTRGGSTRVSRRDQVPTDRRQHKRYSSTEAVQDELRSGSIPPLSFDEQAFASASSIPGTPYEQRHMPDLSGSSVERPEKGLKKKSRRTRSASLTNQSQDDTDDPLPRRKKVPRVPKVTVSTAATNGHAAEDPERQKPPLPPTAKRPTENQPLPPPPQTDLLDVTPTKGPRGKKTNPNKKKKRSASRSSTASGNDTLDRSLDDSEGPNPPPNPTIADQPLPTEDPHAKNEEPTKNISAAAATSQTEEPPSTEAKKKKKKKRSASRSSTASGNDILDRSLNDSEGPNTIADQPLPTEDPNAKNEEPTKDNSAAAATSQTEEPPSTEAKKKKKKKKRTTSKSSTASANETLDRSLDDWNRPAIHQSPDRDVDPVTPEAQPLTAESTPPTVQQLNPPSIPADHKEDDMTPHVIDDVKKADALTADNNNNDLWNLFGMKLNTLCLYLLSGKPGASLDRTKMKNLTNKERDTSPEFIDQSAVVLVDSEVERSFPVTNGIGDDLKPNGLILTSDESNDGRLSGVAPDLSVEIKPPTGKKKKKQSKDLNVETASKTEVRSSEYRMAMSRTEESRTVDDFDSRPPIPDRKPKETELKETTFNEEPWNQTSEIPVLQNPEKRGNDEAVKMTDHKEKLRNAGESDVTAPALNFEYDVDGSDEESPKSTNDEDPIDLMNFDDDRLRVTSWERKEYEDIPAPKKSTSFAPFASTPFRISLKPARSEESLAMRTRSETDAAGYGRRRCDLLASPGRLRVARSVDRLTADDQEGSASLIKRRSLSQEWRIVTVTTKTEEIIVVQKGGNEAERPDDAGPAAAAVVTDAERRGDDITTTRIIEPKPDEIRYVDSEDSMDMDDFDWPAPPPMPDNEMSPRTREFAVKQINADVRLLVPISSNGGGTSSSSNVEAEEGPAMLMRKPLPPRIESTIQKRINTLSRFGYNDKRSKTPPENNSSSETPTTSTAALEPPATPDNSSSNSQTMQTTSTVAEVEPPATPDVPPPLNLDSFPVGTQVNSPDISTSEIVLKLNNTPPPVEIIPRTISIIDRKSTGFPEEDEVFGEKGVNGAGRAEPKATDDISSDTRSVSQDISTQTDQIDGNTSPPTMIAPRPAVIQTQAIVVENTDRSTFELVADSLRLVTRREEKLEEDEEEKERQNTYYVVEHDKCISPVVIHEYGEMLSFCKKQRSLSDAELNIQRTQQQKLEIQLRLQSLWSSGPQRNNKPQQLSDLKSHETLLSDALSAHLANINAAASSRLAETRATYLLETFRTSPTRDHLLSSADAASLYGSNYTHGQYSRRPFSDSTL